MIVEYGGDLEQGRLVEKGRSTRQPYQGGQEYVVDVQNGDEVLRVDD